MSQTDVVLLNGVYIPREEARVDIEDRGYQFGDGIYEVIRIYGGKPFLMDQHLQRLQRSAREIQLKLPYSLPQLKQSLLQLVKRNRLKEGIIYVQISRGVSARSHGFPLPEVQPQLIAYTRETETPEKQQKTGEKAVVVEDLRWSRCDIKSINLLPNVLAKQHATSAQAFEAILHRDGQVTEGSSTNVFIVRGETLITHPANNLILEGITRNFIIELARRLDLTVQEHVFSVKEMLRADEVFITSTTNEIIPIIQIDDQRIGSGAPGQITHQLQTAFKEQINMLRQHDSAVSS